MRILTFAGAVVAASAISLPFAATAEPINRGNSGKGYRAAAVIAHRGASGLTSKVGL